jgi:hypothetical protein
MPEGTLEEFDSLQCRWASVKNVAEGNLKLLESLRTLWSECLAGIQQHKDWIDSAQRVLQVSSAAEDIGAEADKIRVGFTLFKPLTLDPIVLSSFLFRICAGKLVKGRQAW